MTGQLMIYNRSSSYKLPFSTKSIFQFEESVHFLLTSPWVPGLRPTLSQLETIVGGAWFGSGSLWLLQDPQEQRG